MKVKPKIKYTDMAIYIDKHIWDKNKSDLEIEKIFDYLRMLAYMLSCKRRFFNNERYYDDFSNYMAIIVYNRMTSPRQWPHTKKDKNGNIIVDSQGNPIIYPAELTPIKSCLNYMKNIIYARKCAFCFQEFNYTTDDSDSASEAFKIYMRDSVLNNSNELLMVEISAYIDSLDKTILNIIKNGIYGKDKKLVWKLYAATLINLLKDITPKNIYKNKFINSNKLINYMIDDDFEYKIYGVEDTYIDYVEYITAVVKDTIINDIKELGCDYNYSDELIENILMSNVEVDNG